MRLGTTIFLGAALFAGLASAPAFAVPVGAVPAAPGNPGIELAAVHCGPHAHYVRGHRDKDGHHVLGRCVRNKHH